MASHLADSRSTVACGDVNGFVCSRTIFIPPDWLRPETHALNFTSSGRLFVFCVADASGALDSLGETYESNFASSGRFLVFSGADASGTLDSLGETYESNFASSGRLLFCGADASGALDSLVGIDGVILGLARGVLLRESACTIIAP